MVTSQVRIEETRNASTSASIGSPLIYADMSYALVVYGTQSQYQSRIKDLPQNSPLAAILFNRFINSLLDQLNQNKRLESPAALFFADDRVIIAPNCHQAQYLLNVATNWAVNYSIIFNIQKSGHLLPQNVVSSTSTSHLYLHDQQIPLVFSYKYLRVIFARTGVDYSAQAALLGSRITKLINAMMSVSDTWYPCIRLNIFKVILSPMLEYSLPLIFPEHLRNRPSVSWKILHTAYYNSIKWIAGGNANRPHITCNLLGLLPFKDRAIQLSGRFYQHFTKTKDNNPLRCILDSRDWYPKSNSRVKL